MTTPYLALEGVSHVLADGRTLFSGLNETFDHRRTVAQLAGVQPALEALARIEAGSSDPADLRLAGAGGFSYPRRTQQSPRPGRPPGADRATAALVQRLAGD